MIPANEEKDYKLTGHDKVLIYYAITERTRSGRCSEKDESDYRNILKKLGYEAEL